MNIQNDFISIFSSGHSIEQMTIEEIQKIKSKSYTIFLNYAMVKYTPKEVDALFWSDKKVTDWIIDNKEKHKNIYLMGRNTAFKNNNPKHTKFKNEVHYIWDSSTLYGKFSIVWLLKLLQRKYPNKKILLFGVDLHHVENKNGKWYDNYTSYDYIQRKENYDINNKLDNCKNQLIKYIDTKNVYNCNLNSALTHFQKKEWKKIL